MPLLYSFIYLQIADVDFCINGTEFKFYVKPYFLRWARDTFYIKLEFWKECCFLRYTEIKSLQAEITSKKLTTSLACIWHRLRDFNPGNREGISFPESSGFFVSDPCSYLADPQARRLWLRDWAGDDCSHHFTSPPHHSRNSRARGGGDRGAPIPPPHPFSQHFKFNAWSGKN